VRRLSFHEGLLGGSDGGVILIKQGDLDGAMEKNVEEEKLARETNDKAGLWGGLHHQAYILIDLRSDARAALPKCLEVVQILSETGLSEIL
jgi:hypothetical protein